MLVPNAASYKWVIAVDPNDPSQTIGEPKPCMPNGVGWAVKSGYRVLEGDEEKAAIAMASGLEPETPAQKQAAPPTTAPGAGAGVKTTVNAAATTPKAPKAAKASTKEPKAPKAAAAPPAEVIQPAPLDPPPAE